MTEQPEPHLRAEESHDDQRLHRPARPDDERHRIALAEDLDRHVDGGEAGAGDRDQRDRGERDVRVLLQVGVPEPAETAIMAGSPLERKRHGIEERS